MIMIVDDDEAMAETCSMFLQLQGFDVCIASDGADALRQIRHTSPELLISDYDMPGMSGAQLSEAIKADPATAALPILLMSGSRRSAVAINGNFDAFLRKPFLAEHLLIEVRNLLAGLAQSPIPLRQGISAVI